MGVCNLNHINRGEIDDLVTIYLRENKDEFIGNK